MKEHISIPCIAIEQPIGVFYIGKIGWKDLLDIAYSDIRRIEKEGKGGGESYFGIQRELAPKRLKEIAEYVSFSDATFPTSIVLAVSSNEFMDETENMEEINVEFDKKDNILKIRKDKGVAKIIDGQHRVFGIKKAIDENDKLSDTFIFELIVTIFVDMDLDEQSMVFATINKAQTKVNKSLVSDLFDLAKTRSPQKTAHNIVKLLNEKEGSALKDKVKMLGNADDPLRETISQATLVESILKYISNTDQEAMKDRDILKRGSKLQIISSKELKKRFFRNWFILEEDAKIAKVIWNYFNAIKRKWPSAWENSILSKSTGIIAFMKFLSPLVNHLGIEKIITEDNFFEILNRIAINDRDFTIENYKPGATGSSKLYKELVSKSGIQ